MIIGLYIKHIKAYKGINFVPIGSKYNFISYIGENGIGKSSILEALNSFFNKNQYPINKSALNDGIYTIGNDPFIAPIFLIPKERITRKKKEFEKISNFFWNIEKRLVESNIQRYTKEFFELREGILDKQDTHYLFIIGEYNFVSTNPKIYFGSFHNEEKFLIHCLNEEIDTQEIQGKTSDDRKAVINKWQNLLASNYKDLLDEIKELYAYVYIPVETNLESFTKIETQEMQKIFDKQLKDEIIELLNSVNLNSSGGLNEKLRDFISEIERTLNNKYCYDTGMLRNNTLTKTDLAEKILEVYFQKRILTKVEEGGMKKKISELSAGEKRQALIDLVFAFLKREYERERMIIIGIDEPENSLHTSLCYDQFEKLKTISFNNQVMITTHWYGFLPIVSEGVGHFIFEKEGSIKFESYDLYGYRSKIKKDIENSKNSLPTDFLLKSTNDLVQSIYHSLRTDIPYNWLICEGITEKIYLEFFLGTIFHEFKLRVLPMGSQNKVSELYEYLALPIKHLDSEAKGKVFCLVDTDNQRHKPHIDNGFKNLQIRRLSNNEQSSDITSLITLNNSDTTCTNIEQSLNPIIFSETLVSLNVDEKYRIKEITNEVGNTNFIKNLKNLYLEDYFNENNGENKLIFAKEYIRILGEKDENDKYRPSWISEIINFYTTD